MELSYSANTDTLTTLSSFTLNLTNLFITCFPTALVMSMWGFRFSLWKVWYGAVWRRGVYWNSSVYFNENIRLYNPETCRLQLCPCSLCRVGSPVHPHHFEAILTLLLSIFSKLLTVHTITTTPCNRKASYTLRAHRGSLVALDSARSGKGFGTAWTCVYACNGWYHTNVYLACVGSHVCCDIVHCNIVRVKLCVSMWSYTLFHPATFIRLCLTQVDRWRISTLSKALCCWVRGLVCTNELWSYAGGSIIAGRATHGGQV
jgi:hypothetical protein